jgi:aryl-alcohol dehydrogenase-like predicted oxidoreductase
MVRRRPFGTTGLVVSEVGVGCSRLGGMFSAGSSQRDEADLITQAVDAGINFFDTSDLYSHGQSEVLLGKVLRSRRGEVVLATKGGYVRPGQERLLARAKPLVRPIVRALGVKRPTRAGGGGGAPIEQDFRPEHLATALEGSLRRLGTDHIDIYQLHSPPRAAIDAGAFIPVLDRLKAQGKLLHYGIAADAASDLEDVDRHRSITSLQMPFSAIDQSASAVVFPKATAAGVGVISRSCFAAGLLVGSRSEAELREQTPDWKAILAFRSKAAELGRARRELALQFNLGTAPIAVTIVGMSTPKHLDDILRDAAAPPLSADEMASLAALGQPEES